MNPWPFVISAYSLCFLAVAGTTFWAWRGARRAEARAAELSGERD